MNLGVSFELLPNALAIAELAIDKQAATLLMPIAARRQLNELPDALWTRINIEFYAEAKDAFLKALVD
jgi:ATP-dependent Lon protease